MTASVLVSMRSLALWTAMLAVLVAPVRADDDGDWGEVKELEFGEVLFDFYTQNYFVALTRLSDAKRNHTLVHHREHAELLLGGLYLSYGMHEAASTVITGVLEQDVATDIRDRAWFYLGKIRYQRGYLDEAREAFNRIRGRLPPALSEERDVILGNVLMSQGQTGRAIELLQQIGGKTRWSDYGRYNLGVALLNGGRESDGVKLLKKVRALKPADSESVALRDGANLVLGYLSLQRGAPRKAMGYLEDVGLDGLYSNKALLGVGWAYSALERHQQALSFWTELQKRSASDVAVQEGLLAVPYAYGRLKARNRSIKEYRIAIRRFEQEIKELENSTRLVASGALLQQFLAADARRDAGWLWSLPDIPSSHAGRQLAELLASHEFQEGIKSYRDLYFLRRNVEQRINDLNVLDGVAASQQRRYRRWAKRLRNRHRVDDLRLVEQRLASLRRQLKEIEDHERTLELADVEETRMLNRLASLGRDLARLPDSPEVLALRQRRQRLVGVLNWDIARDFEPRLWEAKKALSELDTVLANAKRGTRRFDRVNEKTLNKLAAYRTRAAAQRRRARALAGRLDAVEAGLVRYLQALAVNALTQRRRRLETHLAQARFGIAQVFDRALQHQDDPAAGR